jgi:hypothetical protein
MRPGLVSVTFVNSSNVITQSINYKYDAFNQLDEKGGTKKVSGTAV